VAAIADADIALARRKDFTPMPPRRLVPVLGVVVSAARMLPSLEEGDEHSTVNEADAVLGAMTSLLIYCAHRGLPYASLLVASVEGLTALQNHINKTGGALEESNDDNSV